MTSAKKTFGTRIAGDSFIDGEYDADRWFKEMKGHEMDEERGERCSMCFNAFRETAEYAAPKRL
jgi:predicted adenine nucleotide alpha hydrolase (AANH) superfamily ATPase